LFSGNHLKTITNLIEQLTLAEKQIVFEYLQKIEVKRRLLNFIDSKKNVPFSLNEITEEVKTVRAKRN